MATVSTSEACMILMAPSICQPRLTLAEGAVVGLYQPLRVLNLDRIGYASLATICRRHAGE
jgi:hypothetical protein